ncbi:unnamed protein product [Linum tenue]|uniref:Uncharacterized protein n=1 Tax=Linum tenue TaxID=586396 RepID=A0AAV0H9F5_9ROSI|nr:unnamed protein product [Linum tenue]
MSVMIRRLEIGPGRRSYGNWKVEEDRKRRGFSHKKLSIHQGFLNLCNKPL